MHFFCTSFRGALRSSARFRFFSAGSRRPALSLPKNVAHCASHVPCVPCSRTKFPRPAARPVLTRAESLPSFSIPSGQHLTLFLQCCHASMPLVLLLWSKSHRCLCVARDYPVYMMQHAPCKAASETSMATVEVIVEAEAAHSPPPLYSPPPLLLLLPPARRCCCP